MDDIKTISSADATQNAASSVDFELEFRRTVRYGTKIQVNEIPQSNASYTVSFMSANLFHRFAVHSFRTSSPIAPFKGSNIFSSVNVTGAKGMKLFRSFIGTSC